MQLVNLMSLAGVAVILGLAWVFSNNRRVFRLRTVGWGLGLQLIFALMLLKTPWGKKAFDLARLVVVRILSFTDAGTYFLFGDLFRTGPGLVANVPPTGNVTTHFQVFDAGTHQLVDIGTVFAIHVLPTIIFFSSLMAILYHLGVMQRIIKGMAWLMQRSMGTSGAESLSCAANIFVGQTEAPLVVRPYLPTMSESELMAVMVGGFATVAGGVMAAYVRFGVDAGHLMAASVMSAPAALVIAKIMFPQTEFAPTGGKVEMTVGKEYANLIDSAAGGAAVGLKLAANVGAMLLAFIALVAMINYGLGFLGLSLQKIFGWIFAPLAFTMGIPWREAATFGSLLGTKISVNEFVAYIALEDAARSGALSPRSVVIATYALCGFANFASIAIQIGGIGSVAPTRRSDVAKLGLRAMFGGALASWLTATIAGILTAP